MTITTSAGTPLGWSNLTVIASGRGFEGSAVLFLLVVPVVHEIAVISANVPRNATAGTIVRVNATVANYGSIAETFAIDLYANETRIAEQSPITLQALAKYDTSLAWNTTGFGVGSYTIVVAVPPVVGELNVADNTYRAGQLLLLQTIPAGPPVPSPPAHAKEVLGLSYGRELAVAAALGEVALVFIVLARGRRLSPGRKKGR